MSEYTYKGNKIELSKFIKENGSNYIKVFTNIANCESLISKDKDSLFIFFKENINRQLLVSNIETNIYMSIKEYFLPYRRAVSFDTPEKFKNNLYKIDYVELDYSSQNQCLIVEREETGTKNKYKFPNLETMKKRTGIVDLNPHVILSNSNNIIPLYDINTKHYYSNGFKHVSPFSFVD